MRCRITMENRDPQATVRLYYQINYIPTEVPKNAVYFHAHFRRSRPVKEGEVHMMLEGINGEGHYVGTAMTWQVNHNGWWGEGEIKFYLDGDANPEVSNGEVVGDSTGYPSICGTGADDYFCESYNFENNETKQYQDYTTPYAGMPHVVRPDGVYSSNTSHFNRACHGPNTFREGHKGHHSITRLGLDIMNTYNVWMILNPLPSGIKHSRLTPTSPNYPRARPSRTFRERPRAKRVNRREITRR